MTPARYRFSAAAAYSGYHATPNMGSRLAKSPALGCTVFSAKSRRCPQRCGECFRFKKKSAFSIASLTENSQNPARVRLFAGSERRVTTALRFGSDSAIGNSIRLPGLRPTKHIAAPIKKRPLNCAISTCANVTNPIGKVEKAWVIREARPARLPPYPAVTRVRTP